MAAHSQTSLFILSILIASSLLFRSSEACGINVYWGQNFFEGTLQGACESNKYKYVSLAFFNTFGSAQFPVLDLDGHCIPAAATCLGLSTEIEFCQSKGIKVLLSLGGTVGNYTLSSPEDARDVANYIYNAFLGGHFGMLFRPLGTPLDGVDFDIEKPGSTLYWDDLARALAGFSTPERKVYLSASPRCPYPDPNLDAAIKTGLFNYVWVQFYNSWHQCDYSAGIQNFLASWNLWSSSLPEDSQLFLGLPASPDAAVSGYIQPDVLQNQILPVVRSSSNYGGVMLWDRYYDLLSGYSSTIYPAVCNSTLNSEESLISQV